MDRNNNKEFLANFSKSYESMIAANESSYDFMYGSVLYRKNVTKRYTPEEIDRIIEDGSLADRIALSRTYFKISGKDQSGGLIGAGSHRPRLVGGLSPGAHSGRQAGLSDH